LSADSGKHSGADLIVFVECENEVWPAIALQNAMRGRLAFDRPANALKSRQYFPRFRRGPTTHGVTAKT